MNKKVFISIGTISLLLLGMITFYNLLRSKPTSSVAVNEKGEVMYCNGKIPLNCKLSVHETDESIELLFDKPNHLKVVTGKSIFETDRIDTFFAGSGDEQVIDPLSYQLIDITDDGYKDLQVRVASFPHEVYEYYAYNPVIKNFDSYAMYIVDNGPYYPSQGLFRILKNGKIGYADEKTKEIKIQPQFACASPFEKAKARAKVSYTCTLEQEGEYQSEKSDSWFYIDKNGKTI